MKGVTDVVLAVIYSVSDLFSETKRIASIRASGIIPVTFTPILFNTPLF
jgi:hypothetical protein